MLGGKPQLGKFRAGHSQSHGKVFYKASAAAGTGFVKENTLNLPVLNPYALHILSADIENKLHAGKHMLRRLIVRHGLYFAEIRLKRRLYKVFPVTRGGHLSYVSVLWHQGIYFL